MSAEKVLNRKLRAAIGDAGYVFVRRSKHLIYAHPTTHKTLTVSLSPHNTFNVEREILAQIRRFAREGGASRDP